MKFVTTNKYLYTLWIIALVSLAITGIMWTIVALNRHESIGLWSVALQISIWAALLALSVTAICNAILTIRVEQANVTNHIGPQVSADELATKIVEQMRGSDLAPQQLRARGTGYDRPRPVKDSPQA